MKNTALTEKHIALGAKMVPFAGYNMPVQYEGVNVEHETVRNGVGVFDVSHMGEFLLSGENALNLIQKVTSNDASTLTIGKAQYSCMPNGNGGIVDDLIIYKIKEEQYLLVVNASNIDKDWNWIASHNDLGVEMKNVSEEYSLLAIQGPKAAEAMQTLTSVNLTEIPYYHFVVGPFAGVEHVIISATGYTLRLEMGFCLYVNDIDDSTSPIEAGLGWITKFNKEFIDAETLKQQKENGVTRKLIAFEMIERGIPRHDYEIHDENNNVIGKVTSGTMSPSLKLGIGLGYVTIDNSKVDSEIFISIRDKGIKAKVVKLPFYKKN